MSLSQVTFTYEKLSPESLPQEWQSLVVAAKDAAEEAAEGPTGEADKAAAEEAGMGFAGETKEEAGDRPSSSAASGSGST